MLENPSFCDSCRRNLYNVKIILLSAAITVNAKFRAPRSEAGTRAGENGLCVIDIAMLHEPNTKC